MLNWAKFPSSLRQLLWAQCANHATQLENILCKQNSKTASELFYCQNPPWILHLKIFGEIGIVHDHKKIRSKLADRGRPCIFIGYSSDHAPNVYKFLTMNKQTMIQSRNTVWLQLSYGENIKKHNVRDFDGDDDDFNHRCLHAEYPLDVYEEIEAEHNRQEDSDKVNEEIDIVPDDDDESENNDDIVQIIPTASRRLSGVHREIRNLTNFYNTNPGETAEIAMLAREFNPTELTYASTIHDGNPDPKNYVEAKNSKDWNKWWEAMCIEFKNMDNKKVWNIILKTDVPTGRKLIGNRWVFAQKDDGRYRARTVAKGFSQVPGKDFQENHAPVVNDARFHLVLALKVLFKLEAGQFDIETAFLYGELDEEIWMQLPDGYSEYCATFQNKKIYSNIHCVKLQKALNGLVQAVRQWWKKFKEVMKSIHYIPSAADPCLFINTSNNKPIVVIYVDDGGVFSTKENIDTKPG
jgi:Reverse transcriptase (RNA-dependent DNA polymerase)